MYLVLATVIGLVFGGVGVVMGYCAPVWSALLTLVPLVVIGGIAGDPPLLGLVVGTVTGIAIRIGALARRRRFATRGNLPIARLLAK